MFHMKEYIKRPKKLAHLLPWTLLVAPGTVLNKAGSLQATFKFSPPDLESSTEEELSAVAAAFNNTIKRLGSGWSYFVEAQRKEYCEYPESNWPNNASELIDSERKEFFISKGNYFLTDYYLTFCYMPPGEKIRKLTTIFLEESEVRYKNYLEYFKDEMTKIVDIMETIFPIINMLNDDETLTYLHSCVSTKWHKVVTPKTPIFLDYILSDEGLECGLTPKLGDYYLKIISIKGFPQESYPQMLQELNQIGCSYRWSSRFICLDNVDASNELKKYAKHWFSKSKSIWSVVKETIMNESDHNVDNDAVEKSEECNSAADLINSGAVSSGYYTSCITLFDRDLNVLREKTRNVERIINSKGFVTINETYNCISAWLGSLPGHCWANVRRPLMTSLNLSHLLPLSTNWSGQEENSHLKGPPLFLARSNANTPFMFSNHINDVGHTMVLGPTGSGKSFLLSFIAAQFQRYENAQIYFFDKDYSAYCITMAMNGLHYDLGESSRFCLQPLQNINIESECSWAREWIIEILSQEDNIPVTPDLKRELWDALVSLSRSPEEQRTLTGLLTVLQDNNIRKVLQQYTLTGSFKLLDGSDNSIDVSHFQCFEMGGLIESYKAAVIPVLSYLFHKIEQQFTGNPSMIILDEAWLLFNHPIFANKIKDWLKTLRKKNVSVVFATQSISDIMESSIIHTLIESCPTRIFLPNRKAFEASILEIYKRFGLNERQIEIISSAIPKRQYYCQSDIGCGQFELEAGPITKILCGSSSQEDKRIINKLVKDKIENFTYEFLKEKGGYYETLKN